MSETGAFNVDLAAIDEISIIKAAISNETEIIKLEGDQYHHNVTFQFTPGVNIDLKKVRVIFNCDIKTESKEGQPVNIGGHFDIVFIFNIENLTDLVSVLEEDIEINDDLLASIGNIVYSTSRGIIYTRCQGTILKRVILPIISTQNLLRLLAPNNREEKKQDKE